MAKDSAPVEIAPSGRLYIDTAADIHIRLQKAFSRKGPILFRWDAVEDIDLPVLQLLYAARREARETGRELHFRGLLADRVVSRLTAGGFVAGAPLSGEELESALAEF